MAVTKVNPPCIFGFLLQDTRLYVQRFEQRAAALGLTLPQCEVLVYVANHEGMSQVRLAEMTNLEPTTLLRCVDRLESCGCLERRRDPADRRVRRIYLKAGGKPLVDEIWRFVNLTDREAFAGIPGMHGDLMIELLGKINRNFASLQPLPEPTARALESGRAHVGAYRPDRYIHGN
jgi:MarR family transcriptional regulator, transcriptional regulator for hemolysin